MAKRIPSASSQNLIITFEVFVWAVYLICCVAQLRAETPLAEPEVALREAIKAGDENAAKLQIKSGDDVNSVKTFPLIAAVRKGDTKIVKLLLESGANPNSMDHCGRPALFVAIESADPGMVKILLDAHADPNFTGHDHWRPIFLAASLNSSEILQLLLKKGADVGSQDESGDTPLHRAASNGHIDSVRVLIAAGADVNRENGFHRKPVDYVRDDEIELSVTLRAGKVKPAPVAELPEIDRSMLEAIRAGDSEKVSKLIKSGARVDSPAVPLCMAIERGEGKIARMLLESGANPNSQDAYGRTPLYWATNAGDEALVKSILDKGGKTDLDPNMKPLMAAALRGSTNIVRILIHAGAQVNATTLNFRWTALHFAAIERHVEAARLLVDAGADLSAEDRSDLRPVDLVGSSEKIGDADADLRSVLEKSANLGRK